MNYLAHALFSNNEPNLLIGNFIADHLRGNDFTNYPTEHLPIIMKALKPVSVCFMTVMRGTVGF
jgi:acyl carrier protein phosphodiesterase